jgi:Zn-dependent protease with chaperone function
MTSRWLLGGIVLTLSGALVGAQTKITPPNNKYSLADDLKLGRDAAAQARQQFPIMKDDAVSSYVEELGKRLEGAIPADLRHAEFQYTFEAINVREINAFALPGGPMFVNRGMIEAAQTEGEVVGVMAHELSHVVLRHGTAQASKASKYQVGGLAGAVIGAIIGGNVGSIVAQGTQFGLGTAFMRFGREFEKQADLEGAQIMARAGYDPRDMANMFKTIEKQGGSNGPQWLSDHPNPGNRYDYILKEAEALRVENPVREAQGFERVRNHLKSLPPAPTTEQATRAAKRSGSPSAGDTNSRPTGRVSPPSGRYTEYREGDVFRISVPSNWRELPASNTVTFAPEGGYGRRDSQSVFTHGIELGVTRNEAHDLETATDELVESLSRGNPRLSRPSGYRHVSVDGRPALQTTLDNVSEITGRPEAIRLVTADLGRGSLLYAIAVAPQDELQDYQSVFERIVASIRLMDSRR